MSLGEELRAAGVGLAVTLPTTAVTTLAPRRGLAYFRRSLALAAILLLALIVTGLLIHTAHF
jgi:hypothetical protein